MKNEAASFLLAVQFLTRIPVRLNSLYSPERMAAAVRYYPVVGVLVGGLSAIAFVVANAVFPIVLAVLIAVGVGLLVTGAFHEDGLADTFDGVGGGLTRDKALHIMKDSRLGTYGTLALIIALAVKTVSLMSLSTVLIPLALISAHGLSRLSSVLVIATGDYVRDEGTGKPVAGAASPASLIVGLATGLAIFIGWTIWLPPIAFAWALGGLIIGHLAMRLFFEPKIGGYTGDTLGAVQQSSEIGFYLGLVAWL